MRQLGGRGSRRAARTPNASLLGDSLALPCRARAKPPKVHAYGPKNRLVLGPNAGTTTAESMFKITMIRCPIDRP